MKKVVRLLLVVLMVGILIVIRGFVAPYFYDPLRDYFLSDYLHVSVPAIDLIHFFLHLFLRYFLNTIVSLTLIYLIFKNLTLVQFSVKFYIYAFVILGFTLYLILLFQISDNYMLLFYVRRFLIHPLFVFILLPAFYYQSLKEDN